jgi:hypothetical protein
VGANQRIAGLPVTLLFVLGCTGTDDPADDTGQGGEEVRFSYVSVGIHQSCAVVDGRLGCWGPEPSEIEETATYYGDGHPPGGDDWQLVEMTSMSRDLGHRSRIGCALTTSGQACCWGQYFGDSCDTFVGPELEFSTLAVGSAFACATDDADVLWCWGPNAPDGVVLAEEVADVTAKGWDLSALHTDGSISTWSMTDPEVGTEIGTQYFDHRAFADGDLELQLSRLGAACVVDVGSGDVLCDPFEPSTPSESDGLRSTRLYDVEGRTDRVTGDGRMGICGMGEDGTVLCDAYFGDSVAPGVVAEDAVTFSAAAAGVASGCAVLTDGSLTCWGGASVPTSLRYAD